MKFYAKDGGVIYRRVNCYLFSGIDSMNADPKDTRKPNRLINEKSPYLLQHAYNPVDWYPWGAAAFNKAKAEDKPVFVSIGYSSCHWCHVMEHESFEDEEVAKVLNESFVCVKVDREERPDLDGVYMAVCQAMGRNCGWPLNVILTPDKHPFFATSYIPKNSRFGLVGIIDLVSQINLVWRTRRSEMEALGKELSQRVSYRQNRTGGEDLTQEVLDEAYGDLVMRFDEQNGGFGSAPKFPSPHNLLFLMRYWKRTGEETALKMVEKTLRAMRLGGIFDQIGFGFHRYSTDAYWLMPHFEKMLYDQALLAIAYLEAFQATGAPKFRLTAKEILEYVLRDLSSPEGAFHSAEDADSEGEEGKFYLWTEQEIRNVLPSYESDLAIKIFGIEPRGNYDEAHRNKSGENILYFPKSIEQIASETHLSIDEFILELGKIRDLLFKARGKRIRPKKDDKILTDWNGLMIAGLARGSRVLKNEEYLKTAIKALDFILDKMLDNNGFLYHRYAKGESAIEGFLDDYAFLIWGIIEIYEACFEPKYLQIATDLSKIMIERFWDNKLGGFFFRAKGSEEGVPPRKEVYDGAYPSGNSVALLNLLKLALLIRDSSLADKSIQIIQTFSDQIKRMPAAYTHFLFGVDFAIGPNYNVVIVGDSENVETNAVLRILDAHYLPNMVLSLQKRGGPSQYEKIECKTTAYVCRGSTCMPPTNNIQELLQFLDVKPKIKSRQDL